MLITMVRGYKTTQSTVDPLYRAHLPIFSTTGFITIAMLHYCKDGKTLFRFRVYQNLEALNIDPQPPIHN